MMSHYSRPVRNACRRSGAVAVVLLVVGSAMMVPVAPAEAVPPESAVDGPAPAELSNVAIPPDRVLDPDNVLGATWRGSTDRAVTTAGDETGLHVLVADRREAYRWQTVATLAEPLIDSDQWIGQLCVTGSGRYALVVYAPRTFTNYEALMERGAFAAAVDLDTGKVSKLDQRVTLAYYNPSCGVGDIGVLSRLEQSRAAEEPAKTWIATVNAATASIEATVRADGQVTAAVPIDGRVLAAKGHSLVEVDTDGGITVVALTRGAPLRLMPDGERGLAFQVAHSDAVELVRLASGEPRTVATVPVGAVKLRSGAGGDVYVIGERATERVGAGLPPSWRVVEAPPDSEPSTEGGMIVSRARTMREAAGRVDIDAPDDPWSGALRIAAATDTGVDLAFATWVAGEGEDGRLPSPALAGLAARGSGTALGPDDAQVQQDYSDVPWDPDRACAVPRNHPEIQVYQPSPEQVEWAANLAVRGQLDFSRPANWLNSGLPAYSPQGTLFPMLPLAGGGHVPAQIYLGILAQESNLWQATHRVVDALAGNPLISTGFYGLDWDDPDPTTIDWSDHDCGYGAAQVTSGMHRSDTGAVVNGVVMTETRQRAAVVDYATNIAAGLRILQSKWNETYQAGIRANNSDPQYIENWFFAVWAYNSGMQPDERFGNHTGCAPGPSCTDEHGNWGLGWSNNPASPLYPEDRRMFLLAPLDHPDVDPPDQIGYDNAKHPNHWSYSERVMGWAYTSLIRWDYHTQTWRSTYLSAGDPTLFEQVQPHRWTFCVASVNECDPAAPPKPPADFPGYPAALCQRDDLRCWWNESATWVPDCDSRCGVEARRFTTVEPRPLATSVYRAQCSTEGLPQNARVVTTIDYPTPRGPTGCERTWNRGGTFSLNFESVVGSHGDPIYPGKVDFHQIGGGFGGHFWFAHSHRDPSTPMKVTGTWTPDNRFDGWVRVMAHLPDHGARSQQARYEVHTGTEVRERFVPMRRMEHSWITLGTYRFSSAGPQRVELSNITEDGRGVDNVTWDALAFVPLAGKPEHFVVAIGDSYISGEGAGDYYTESANNYGTHRWNACRRSKNSWPRKTRLPDSQISLGLRADILDPSVDFQFVACSGARIPQIRDGNAPPYWQSPPSSYQEFREKATGQFGEMHQIRSGTLSEDTTLVLLTAGGNDAGFSDVLEECAMPPGCPPQIRYEALRQQVYGIQDGLRQLIRDVHVRAPNANIQLVGYPRLFAVELRTPCGGVASVAPGYGFSRDEAVMINWLADDMRDAQHEVVTELQGEGVPVYFTDTFERFGDHGACQHLLGPDEGINSILRGPRGGGDRYVIDGVDHGCFTWAFLEYCVSRESMHPNDHGTTLFADGVTDRLVCPTCSEPQTSIDVGSSREPEIHTGGGNR